MKTLDLNVKQDVRYAIPLWLRNEQIKQAIARCSGRIQPATEPRNEPIAIVGYGPSLKHTWEKVKDFKFVMTCSGAHKFLLEKGIVPSFHCEVDPREHKVGLLGPVHKEVEYLPSSTCHPKYFDHLIAGTSMDKIKIWHVFDPSDDGVRMLPPGEWAVTGGCDVGLRCLTIAGFLGFRELHIFGLDGSAESADSARHAADHPNSTPKYSLVQHEGKDYYTTPGMLEAARQTAHELDQMPNVKATFYGEGLTQALVKSHVPKPIESSKPLQNIVAFSRPELISAEYRELNVRLHHDNLAYGVGGSKHADTVKKLSTELKTTSILDYGCGKGLLAKELPFPIWEYDPAVPEKSDSPRPADIVVCTDVLEHIEPDKIHAVLSDLKRVTRKVGYFVIHTGPSGKVLADGRNSHILQKDRVWWKGVLRIYFEVPKEAVIELAPLLFITVGVKQKKLKAA
jgi:hypothetical protein